MLLGLISAAAFLRCSAFGLLYFCGHMFFLCVLESLRWNRKSDILFTGLSVWEVSDVAWLFFFFCWNFQAVFVVGGKRLVTVCRRDVTLWLSLVLFCFDLLCPLTCSHHSSAMLRVEVLTTRLLCLGAVWLSGLFFLPLLNYGLIIVWSS